MESPNAFAFGLRFSYGRCANAYSIVQPVAKKLARATGSEDYNILQNNGRLAHQEVDHVICFHHCAPYVFFSRSTY